MSISHSGSVPASEDTVNRQRYILIGQYRLRLTLTTKYGNEPITSHSRTVAIGEKRIHYWPIGAVSSRVECADHHPMCCINAFRLNRRQMD